MSTSIGYVLKRLFHKLPDQITQITKGVSLENRQICDLYFHKSTAMNLEDTFSYQITFSEDGLGTLKLESPIYKEGEYFETPISTEEVTLILQAIKEYQVGNWNGFHGIDPDVCDGGGFSLELHCQDGTCVSASGSNAYPKHFGDFQRDLFMALDHYRKQYHYDRIPKTLSSDEMTSSFISFKQQGKAGRDEFDFQIWNRAMENRDNFEAKIIDRSGEFMEAENQLSNPLLINVSLDKIDLSGLQRIVRKYDLPKWNGYDRSDPDYSNKEWFQLHFSYVNGESIDIYGTLAIENYRQIRKELLTECFRITEEIKNEKQKRSN